MAHVSGFRALFVHSARPRLLQLRLFICKSTKPTTTLGADDDDVGTCVQSRVGGDNEGQRVEIPRTR